MYIFNEEGTRRNRLTTIATDSAGIRLKKAVDLSSNEILKIRLSDCTDPGDAHAKDIAYHKQCWTVHVVNVLRPKYNPSEGMQQNCVLTQATNVEFLSSLSEFLQEGNVTTMGKIEEHYRRIASDHGLNDAQMKTRKQIKALLEEELESIGIVFSNPKRVREPQRVSLKAATDVAMSAAEESYQDIEKNMGILFQAARILRRAVLVNENWEFTGSFEEIDIAKVVPKEVSCFFKWCTQGQVDMEIISAKQDFTGLKKAHRLSQFYMYEMLSKRQAANVNCTTTRHIREMPLQVAVGLTMHACTRSRFLIQFLHNIGASIDYGRVLRLETKIATEVVKSMDEYGGAYVPSQLVKGRFVYCAADNIDFLEDTPYGKGTLHGTVMVVYQEKEDTDASTAVKISGPSSLRSLRSIPPSLSEVTPCIIPKGCRPENPLISQNNNMVEKNIIESYWAEDVTWMMASILPLSNNQDVIEEVPMDTSSDALHDDEIKSTSKSSKTVPTWSAYNSVLNEAKKETRVCVLPLIETSPTNTSIQLTFMKKLEKITSYVTPQAKTVVSLDLGLYKPVLKLAMANKELSKNWVLRPGELHIIMAMLRAIGSFLDGTGLDSILSSLYDDSTVTNILAGKCVRRAIEAHISLRLALFKCYIDEFYKLHPQIKEKLEPELEKLVDALQGKNSNEVKSMHNKVTKLLKDLNVLAKMKAFNAKESEEKPTFRVVLQYMQMVDTMLIFIRSVRTANWDLHLAALEEFVKYFFALDLTNYSSMIAWYIADMKQLESKHPDLWNEFKRGNWVVHKSKTSFCALGADEALEHENRAMKVLGGLVNITQKKPALTRFFLTSPELSRLTAEAKSMFAITEYERTNHHHLTASKAKQQQQDFAHLYTSLTKSTNPITYNGNELINIHTKYVFDKVIERDTSEMTKKGCQMYTNFKKNRIESDGCSLWDPMKKERLHLCKSARKTVKTKVSDTIVHLKADRALFTRLLVASRSRTDIDLCNSISKYEFSAVPLSMFNLDGTVILSGNKSNLMKILEGQQLVYPEEETEIPSSDTADKARVSSQSRSRPYSVAVFDGMAELQKLKKTPSMKTCQDLAIEFCSKLDSSLQKYDETHLVFDTYLENSLKNAMRRKRAGKTTPVEFKISDSTNITNISMRTLLSHSKTKDELTAYISEKAIVFAQKMKRNLVTSWRNEAKTAEGVDVTALKSTHEEADTKIILHCLYASHHGATTLHIFSPDTDVFILSIWWSGMFPPDTMFVTGVGQYRRMIDVSHVRSCLGSEKVMALLGLHALSGCDVTGCLARKGKASFWKAFKTSDVDVLASLGKLGCPDEFTKDDEQLIEKFICQVYLPGTKISDIGELRWYMFTKKDTQNENLPPTRAALTPYISRTNYQVLEWRRADQPHPNLPDPLHFGWEKAGESYTPVTCLLPCAPDSVIQLVRCSCLKGQCAVNCKCRTHSLVCTELCRCGGDENLCTNYENEDETLLIESDDEL